MFSLGGEDDTAAAPHRYPHCIHSSSDFGSYPWIGRDKYAALFLFYKFFLFCVLALVLSEFQSWGLFFLDFLWEKQCFCSFITLLVFVLFLVLNGWLLSFQLLGGINPNFEKNALTFIWRKYNKTIDSVHYYYFILIKSTLCQQIQNLIPNISKNFLQF
jgi:hypothetical protein